MAKPDEPEGGAGFVTGLLLGLLAGAVLATIAAPQSGEETREALRAKAREATDRARDAAGEVTETVSGTTIDLLARGRGILDEARARLDGAVAEGKEAAEEQRSQLEHRT